jgi:hypothetical protein
MAKITDCRLDGVRLISSTFFSADCLFQAISGVYLSSDLLALRGIGAEA